MIMKDFNDEAFSKPPKQNYVTNDVYHMIIFGV